MLWSTTARANEHRPLDLHVAELSKAGDPAWAVRPGAGVSGAYPPWSMGPPLAAAPRRRRPACAAVSTGGQGRVSARAPAAARRRAPPPGAAPPRRGGRGRGPRGGPAPAGPAAGAAAALADALTLKGWKAGESGSGACARAAWRLAQCAHYMPAFVQPLHPTLRARLPVRIRGTVAGLPTAQASRLPHAAKPKVAVTYGSKLKRPAKVIAGDRTLAARAYLKGCGDVQRVGGEEGAGRGRAQDSRRRA